MSIEHVRPLDIVDSKRVDFLLINVPSTFKQGIISDDESPPFGLLRIAQLSERSGFKSALLDANKAKLTLSNIDSIIFDINPKLVGINPTSVNIPEAQSVAEICHHHNIPLVVGGVHATLDPFVALKKDFPSSYAVVKGKGEIPTLKILRDYEKKQQIEINGLYYQTSKSTRVDFADYYPINNLPLNDQRRWVENPLVKKVVKINGENVELMEASLYETLGCPFQCTFCATPAIMDRGHGHKTYYRPQMSRILENTKLAIDMGANAVHFIDDMAFVSAKDFRDYFDGIKNMDLKRNFYWRGMTRAPIICNCTDEDLKILSNSGCWRIAMGVESGDESILKRIKKGITLDQVREAVFRLKKAGIPELKAFFIMGFPDETLDQIENTRRFIMELKSLGLTQISVFQFKPYPRTEEWRYLERTNPEVLKNLYFIKNGNNNNLIERKISRDASLPDDLQISKVPSKIVKQIVTETIKEFYGN